MRNPKKTVIILTCIWSILFPVVIFLTYQYAYLPDSINPLDIIGFLILISIVAFLPIVVNDTPIFFAQGVSLAVFLVFGLVAEMLFMQVAILSLFARLRLRRRDYYRLPLNLIMFLLISLLCGLCYYALGGNHLNPSHTSAYFIVPIIGYILTNFFSNQYFLYFIRIVMFKKQEQKMFSKDLVWDGLASLLIYPVGIVLYMLYMELGLVAILFVGIPFISISLILQLFYSSKKLNVYLQEVSEFGHHLAERVETEDVMNLFLDKLSKMVPADFVFLLDVDDDDDELHLIKQIGPSHQKVVSIQSIKKHEGICGQVLASRKSLLFRSRNEWKNIISNHLPESAESILCVPISRNQKVVGIIFIAANQKRAYEKSQQMLVEIMASYYAVTIENAKHYEETKNNSERCPLTKLYNYRYFEGLLEREFEKLINKKIYQNLSLMLLDLDHFKSINDNYGHQSGNEVLIEIANRIVDVIGMEGTVARYGGEEFVVILPNVNRNECLLLAEEVRKEVAGQPFTIHHNLENGRRRIMVRVTVSIGIASAPFDADDAFSLVRHADRAMYTGAKQAGRNKVAHYIK